VQICTIAHVRKTLVLILSKIFGIADIFNVSISGIVETNI
jgi:hypothetical protein